jgi:hypothetical protein
MKERTTSNTNP